MSTRPIRKFEGSQDGLPKTPGLRTRIYIADDSAAAKERTKARREDSAERSAQI